MCKVFCQSKECVHWSESNLCTCEEVELHERVINTFYEGYKLIHECNMYELAPEYRSIGLRLIAEKLWKGGRL